MNDLRAHVEGVLRTEVAPLLEMDPAELTVTAVADGIASVRFGPTCSNCPGGLHTLVLSVEAELKQRVPEIEIVEAVV
jgi:Fe-S cluster biogenesis protein NfuA